MARDDWAIVVGIKRYFDPALAGLEGPENDARQFYEWVVSPSGGAVPKAQAKLIVSSDYPAFTTVPGAMPTAEAITGAFTHLHDVAQENADRGKGMEVGRRLYLFFSGHGFVPHQSENLTALLTAETSFADAQLKHVIGSYMADAYWRARFFDEILLFMDCCRSVMDCAQLYMPIDEGSASDYYQVRRFYAYGARVAKESREWKMQDGQYHGVFTATLLDALNGAGSDPASPSKITAESLRDQLYNGFRHFMSPQDQQRIDLPKEPEVDFEQKPGGNFTIVTRGNVVQGLLGLVRAESYPVTIHPSAGRVGRKATLRDRDLKVIREGILSDPFPLSLSKGLYLLEIAGEAEPIPFEVAGAGKQIDV